MLGRLFAAVVAAIVAFAGVANAETVLRVALHSDLKIIDPVWTTALISTHHGNMIYDTLFAVDDKLQVRPQMVDKWEVSPDKLTWTFTLREGLQWSDGLPVTAEDCAASIKRWGAKDSMGQKLMSEVADLSAPDTRTIKMVLKEPYGLVLESLGKSSSNIPFMMPRRVAETDPNTQITDATGSGPFIFKKDEWKAGEKAVYVKNPNYKPRSEPPSGLSGGKVAKVDRVEWIWIPDQQTQINALLNGEVDLVEIVPPDLLPLLQKEKTVKTMVTNLAGRQYAMRFNVLHKPFDNAKVRQAVLYALDEKEFLEANIGNPDYYVVCKSLFPCGSPLESTKGWEDKVSGNTAKAKQILQEAGYDGTPVVLLQPSDLGVLTNLAPVAKSQLERAGFKVELQSMDWQSLVNRVISKKGPITEGGWNAFATSWVQADLLDPLMTPFLAANCEKARAGWPCDAAIEKVRDAYARASAPEEKKRIATEAQVLNTQVVTHIPLGEWYQVGAVRANVTLPEPLPPVTVFWGVEKK